MTAVDRLGRWSVAAATGLFVATACAHVTPQNVQEGAFFGPDGRALTDGELSARLRSADFVLVGEAHDNVCDHQQEARITTLMAGTGRPFALGLEMVTLDRQGVLDQFSAGQLDLPALEAALNWKKSWGFSFDWYAPSFEAARKAGAPVLGLNLSDTLVHSIRDGGLESVPADQRQQLPPQLIPPGPEQEKMLREAFDAHHHAGPKALPPAEAWARFLRVQSVWDTVMAWRAAHTAKSLQRPVLILAGAGHVEHGWGIARRLRVYAPEARLLAVMPWHGGEFDPSEGDLFYVCPATPEPPPQSAAAPRDSVMLTTWKKPPSIASPLPP